MGLIDGGGGGGSTGFAGARAYLTAAASNAGSGWEKVPLDTLSFDPKSIWDGGNARFMPTAAGLYLCSGRVRASTTNEIVAAIGKNGTVSVSIGSSGLVNFQATGGADLIYCNGTTDYLELFARCGSSENYTTGSFDTYLSVLGPF